MKRSIFEELWNGQLAPYKACGQNDPEVEELVELIGKNRETLYELLGGNQKDLLRSYMTYIGAFLYCPHKLGQFNRVVAFFVHSNM